MKTMFRSFSLLAFGATAALALGCSSSPSNPTDGPVTGGILCPTTPQMTDNNTVSDFEDGRAAILQFDNRNGGWYAYNDIADAEFAPDPSCTETPVVNRCAMESPAATAIPGGRCGSSNYAFRFFGSGCVGYAGVGTDLAAPLPVDGGADPTAVCADGGIPGVAKKTPYDLTNYKAISFWGRMGDQAVPRGQQVQFKVPMLKDTKIADGGECNLPGTGQMKCSASYGKFLAFTQTWKEYTVNLDPTDKTNGISQETWGMHFDWDPTNVTSIQFQSPGSATFDVWIDDIRLIPKS